MGVALRNKLLTLLTLFTRLTLLTLLTWFALFETVLHCYDIIVHAYIYIVREG